LSTQILRSIQFTGAQQVYDFPEDCKLPKGETASFSYGCEQGAYQMRLKKAGPVHVATTLGLSAPEISLEINVAVTSGLGTQPGNAMIGIGCIADRDRGYVALIKTASGGIVRLEGDFVPLRSLNYSPVMLSGETGVRPRISCVSVPSNK